MNFYTFNLKQDKRRKSTMESLFIVAKTIAESGKKWYVDTVEEHDSGDGLSNMKYKNVLVDGKHYDFCTYRYSGHDYIHDYIIIFMRSNFKAWNMDHSNRHIITIRDDGQFFFHPRYTMDKLKKIITIDRVDEFQKLVKGGPIALTLAF